MIYRRPVGALPVAALLAATFALGWTMTRDKFSHRVHAHLFSDCSGCHTVQPAGVSFPSPSICETCHNGQTVRRIDWTGPSIVVNKFGFNHAEYLAEKQEAGEQVACTDCHAAPGAKAALDVQLAPAWHTPFFLEDHRSLAATSTEKCAVCHNVDRRCLGCHQGAENLDTPAREQSRYHPENFMQRHSAAAWNRDVECASCHNPDAFCRQCHMNLGRGTDRQFRTDTHYHNDDPNFVLGHGQAARQGLESCQGCHAQSDCLQCHAAVGPRRISPHGPGFDPDRLQDKNPQFCLFCHLASDPRLGAPR